MLPAEDAPGYRVLDQAGQGGFAVVYRAYQERLDRVVALKVLSVDRVDQRTMRRFQRELQLTGRLTGHPNVVTVFDTGVTRSGKPYIAMDFFENGSLRDRVRKEGPLPVPDVLRAGVKLAGALAAVHEAGVLHGDIKPQNILISRYGELAIADFGVARVVDAAEISATSQAFTPLHAAPEVLTGQPHSASTDIYSLGSTLYHLLAGQPAFHNPADPSIAPLMYRVLSVEPPPLNRPDVPPVLFEVVLRAMAKQPEIRYGTARDFARRLQQVQAELGLSVTDLVGEDPGPGPTMSTVPRPRHDGPEQPADHASMPFTGNHLPPFPATVPPPHPAATTPPATTPPAASPPAAMPAPGPGFAPEPAPVPGSGYAPHPAHQPGYPPGPSPRSAPAHRSSPGPQKGIIIGLAVATVVLGGAALAIFLSVRQDPADPVAEPRQTQQQQTEQQQPPAENEQPIDQQEVAALAPRGVQVTSDQGALVELRWTLPAGARRYPVVLQRSPIEQDENPITALAQGTTTTRVAGLDPGTGYCFLVGVPLSFSENSTVAWSKPACIRGAVARSPQ
ncbi:serine/threonine-protein kinase [Nonomuraea jiangxiensis]|uniref:non-specific serine/threonine protein kinase n=1 Tax=Nonomuraea jiangxiensis TaxID=633440 RepID=A0A1G8CV64_9ACTN|nr:serine/threonine-protein kinase [Nonomuraea jiangxiensis]SDH49059.1 Serine/threonine protein kinase [Nonomuraea jiangxiensis]